LLLPAPLRSEKVEFVGDTRLAMAAMLCFCRASVDDGWAQDGLRPWRNRRFAQRPLREVVVEQEDVAGRVAGEQPVEDEKR
jgi:hypothetical protein